MYDEDFLYLAIWICLERIDSLYCIFEPFPKSKLCDVIIRTSNVCYLCGDAVVSVYLHLYVYLLVCCLIFMSDLDVIFKRCVTLKIFHSDRFLQRSRHTKNNLTPASLASFTHET